MSFFETGQLKRDRKSGEKVGEDPATSIVRITASVYKWPLYPLSYNGAQCLITTSTQCIEMN